MIVVNIWFVRVHYSPFTKRKVRESKSVTGVEIDAVWGTDHVELRKQLMKHAPAGEGWYVAGYANITEEEHNAN